jgi:hypothetical protein
MVNKHFQCRPTRFCDQNNGTSLVWDCGGFSLFCVVEVRPELPEVPHLI